MGVPNINLYIHYSKKLKKVPTFIAFLLYYSLLVIYFKLAKYEIGKYNIIKYSYSQKKLLVLFYLIEYQVKRRPLYKCRKDLPSFLPFARKIKTILGGEYPPPTLKVRAY